MPRRFTAAFQDRQNPYELVPQDLTFEPQRWSGHVIGGPVEATIAVTGPTDRLYEVLRLLGDSVEIKNENGSLVFWGYVHESSLNYGGVEISLSLDGVHNRIATTYVYKDASGADIQAVTDFVEDAGSIEKFGQREVRLSFDGELDEAVAFRNQEFARTKNPVPVVRTTQGSPPGGSLHCRGIWQRLGWQYYANNDGLVEYTTSGPGEQYIGASYTATTISFATNPGEKDDIRDTANPSQLSYLVMGDTFFVAGAASAVNNTTPGSDRENGFVVVSTDVEAGPIQHIETVDKERVLGAAGPSIVVSLGGPKINRIAQSFTLPVGSNSWTAAKASVRVEKVNGPTDNLIVELCVDSGGSPGGVLDTGTIAGTAMFDDMDWVEVDFTNTVTLAISTTYWLSVRRSATATLANYFIVDVDEDAGYAGGAVKVYDGAAWATRSPAADMPFRITGRTGTMGQVREMIEQNDEFGVDSVDVIDTSNVKTWQYRDGTTLALDEIEELLEIGTLAGEKLLALATVERRVLIYKQPVADDAALVLKANGDVTLASGAPLEPGLLIAGQWLTMDFLPVVNVFPAAISLFVAESEYDARADKLNFATDGAQSVWRLTKVRQG